MNKQKENERDLKRLKGFFSIIIIVLGVVILYGGLYVIKNNIPKTIEDSLISSLAILGLYFIAPLFLYIILKIQPKTEKELAIKKATDKIEAEFKLKEVQKKLKKLCE